jgi:hypothetical protein
MMGLCERHPEPTETVGIFFLARKGYTFRTRPRIKPVPTVTGRLPV